MGLCSIGSNEVVCDVNGSCSGSQGVPAILGLGSNIGSKRENIARALAGLAAFDGIDVVKRSRDYKTPPWGETDQDWFVNTCVLVNTTLTPYELLARCLSIEREMGRERGRKWGPRVIDLDILVFGELEICESDLVVPHPYITERAFVLAPLVEIAPDLLLKGKTVQQWLNDVSLKGIEPFE